MSALQRPKTTIQSQPLRIARKRVRQSSLCRANREKFTRDALQRAPHIVSLRVVPRTNSPEKLLRANVLVTCESHGVVLLRTQQHSHHATSEKHTITQGTPHIFDATTLVNHNNQWQRQVLEGTSLPPTFLNNRRTTTTLETDEVLWL